MGQSKTPIGPNDLLKRAREARGWSQKRVATMLQVDPSMVSRWERGERGTDYLYQEKLCTLFDKTATELGFMDEADQGEETKDKDPITIQKVVFQFLGASTFDLFSSSQLGQNAFMNGDRLTLLENEMAARWTLYHTGGAAHASLGLDIWIQEVARYAQSLRGTAMHNRAHTLLAMGYQLQGCVLRDTMHYAEAYQRHRKAFFIAQELYDPELIAASLAREGVTLNQQEKPLDAIECFHRALEVIKHLGYAHLEGYIFQALSEAQAKVQQSYASRKSIEQVEQIVAQKSETPEKSLVRMNVSSLTAQKGVNAVLLHDYEQAIQFIDQSLARYDPTLIRGRARLIAQKADAYYQLGHIEACVKHAQEALVLAKSVGATKTVTKVKEIHTGLLQSPQRKERDVAALSDVLRELHEGS